MTSFPAFTSRDRRVLVLGGGTIAILLLVGRGVPMSRRWAIAARANAAAEFRRLSESEMLVRTTEATRDSLAARSHRLEGLQSTLLTGDSPTAAVAQLASAVSANAARSGVQLGAMEIHVDSARPSRMTSVQVRASATGDIEGVTHFVGLLESAPVRYVVRSFVVTQSDPAGSVNQPETLHVDIVVQGLTANVAAGVPR